MRPEVDILNISNSNSWPAPRTNITNFRRRRGVSSDTVIIQYCVARCCGEGVGSLRLALLLLVLPLLTASDSVTIQLLKTPMRLVDLSFVPVPSL